MALSARRVANLKRPGRYGDGGGLLLKVTPGGAKSWQFRYQRAGRERFMGLGPARLITLVEARDLALAARKQLLAGIDPMQARAETRARAAAALAQRITFAEAAQQYFELHEAKWGNAKHRAQFLSTLRTYAFPTLGQLPVDAIDTGLVLKVLDAIWRSKPETASRVRGRIENVLSWCIVRGLRTAPNPAAWTGHLKEALPARAQIAKVEHHPALPYPELPSFMAALRTRQGFAARALEFTILTAARTGETVSARWGEIDLKNGIWTVPAGRMKVGKEHRVPLAASVLALLNALPRENDFIFPGPRTALGNKAMARLLKRMGRDDVTVHGFRSSFRDWAAETTAFPNHVVELALAHVIGDAVEAAYRRGDLYAKRARLMEVWATYCAATAHALEAVPIRAVR